MSKINSKSFENTDKLASAMTNPPKDCVKLAIPVPSQLVRDNLPVALKPAAPRKFQINLQTYNDKIAKCGTYQELIAHYSKYKKHYNSLNYCTLFYHLGKKVAKLNENQFTEALCEIGSPLFEITEAVKKSINRYDTQGLSNIACSVVYLQLGSVMPELLHLVAETIIKNKMQFKKPLELSLLAWAYAQCGYTQTDFLHYLAEQTVLHLSEMDSGMVLTIIESFDTLKYYNELFLAQIIHHINENITNFDLLATVKILKILNKYPTSKLHESTDYKSFKDRTKKLCLERVDTLSPQIIVHIAKAFSRMSAKESDLNIALSRRMLTSKLSQNSLHSFTSLIFRL